MIVVFGRGKQRLMKEEVLSNSLILKEVELADKELVLDGNFLLLEAQQYSPVSILQSN